MEILKIFINKFVLKIQELEAELDAEQRNHQETLKEVKKNDKRIKEIIFQAEEDRNNHTRLQDAIDQLQNKLKVYKRQAEEAEEIAAANLAKFRKAQREIEEAEERANIAESQLSKLKTKNRTTVSPQVNLF